MSFRIRNQVQLVGRLSQALHCQRLSDESLVVNTQLVLDDAVPTSEDHQGRLFHLVGWSRVAESMHRNLSGGQRIMVQGRLVNKRQYHKGLSYYRTEIHVSEFMLLQEPPCNNYRRSNATITVPAIT